MALLKNATTILFDLDGTLTDPKESIVNSLAHALRMVGHEVPPLESLTQYIGPPLSQNFRAILGDGGKVEQAVAHYRQRYDVEGKGMTECLLYPQIPQTLAALVADGKRLLVATSKPHPIASKIIRHFALEPYFDFVYGSELDGTRGDKGELIAYIVEREKLDPAATVMIGDRKHDIIGAAKNNIKGIGVCWGYGSREELTAAGAAALAAQPSDLLALLLPDAALEAKARGVAAPTTL